MDGQQGQGQWRIWMPVTDVWLDAFCLGGLLRSESLSLGVSDAVLLPTFRTSTPISGTVTLISHAPKIGGGNL